MLTDEQILPVCYFWAKRLCTNNYPFNELVNEAYTHVKELRSPLLLQKWVKWKMIQYITGRRKEKEPTIDIDVAESLVADTSFNFKDFMEMNEELLSIINTICCDDDKQLLYARFWLNMTYEEIAKSTDVVFQTIYFRVSAILAKLRREYERRTK